VSFVLKGCLSPRHPEVVKNQREREYIAMTKYKVQSFVSDYGVSHAATMVLFKTDDARQAVCFLDAALGIPYDRFRADGVEVLVLNDDYPYHELFCRIEKATTYDSAIQGNLDGYYAIRREPGKLIRGGPPTTRAEAAKRGNVCEPFESKFFHWLEFDDMIDYLLEYCEPG